MSKQKIKEYNLKRPEFNKKLKEIFEMINKRDKRLLGWNPNPEAYVLFTYADEFGNLIKINAVE